MNNLRLLREKNKLSLRDLSEKIGLSPSALSLVENGKRGITDDDIELFCNFYHVSADYLLGRKEPTSIDNLQGYQLALYEYTKNFSEEQMVDLLKYAEFTNYRLGKR